MSAFSLETSGLFDEDDGRWSTFNLDVGTGPSGPQSFRAVVSTSSFSALLPDRLSCVFEGAPSNCSYSRGVGQYQGRQNSGYDGNRSGSLVGGGSSGIELVMLGGQVDPELLFGSNYSIGATVWVDYISLRGSSSFQNIHNPVPIYSVKSLRYLLAMIGVGYGTHELANRLRKDVNSTLLSMVSESAIPSPSWAYTAGAYYDQSRLGSLVFGGYDQSRIEGVPVQFDMGPPALTELAVSVSSIVIDGKSTGVASTQHTFTAIVDSTLPYLFLPNATCDWLAKQLNLQFDDLAELYIIDPTSLRYNMGNITSIAITLGPTNSSPPSSNLTIRFPYDAFNSNASWVWGWESQQHIFPIKRAPSSIAVLGRVFFQEAYVIVDYDRNNFSISQTTNSTSLLEARSKAQAANISFPSLTNITSIHSKNATDPSSTKLGMGTIAGIVIGIILGISLVVALFWLFIIKPKRQEKKRKEEEAAEKTENTDGIRTISELTAKPSHRKHMPEAQNFDSEIHEMEQNSKPGELDGNAVAELEQKPAELEGNHAHAHADPERADADAGVGTRGEQVETDHTTSRDGP